MTLHTIPLDAVQTAIFSAQLRRRTGGGTALLAAYTPRPVIDLDCHRGTAPFAGTVARAAKEGTRTEQAALMERGHIAQAIQRVRNRHGLAGVRKTFGAGMKELANENRLFLHAGKKGGNHGL